MENIKAQFTRLYMELDLTDDQAAMIKKLQRDVDAALRQSPVSGSVCRCKRCNCEIRNDVGDGLCAECWSAN